MQKKDNWYKADKGNIFVLTMKGKCGSASYRNLEVGKPIEGYETWTTCSDVENEFVKEILDPDWVVLPGYRAVYDVDGDGKYIFDTCNPIVYHDREMAEAAVIEFNKRPWHDKHQKAFVIDATYEGKRPKACREYNGKKVYNRDYWTYNRPIGSYVEEEIAMDAANCVPPRNFSRNYIQCGEPADSSMEGTLYATFVKISSDIWEYKGNCLAGKTEANTTPIPYVKGA